MRLFTDALGLLPIRRRGIHVVSLYLWPKLQDTGVSNTHDKPSCLTYPV